MQSPTHQRQKIIFSLVISYLAVMLMVNAVFLANTPRVNPLFISKLKSIPSDLVKLPSRMLASLMSVQKPSNYVNPNTNSSNLAQTQEILNPEELLPPKVTAPSSVVFKPLVKGVLAGEDPKTNSKYVTIKGGTRMQITNYKLTLADGTQKNIRLLIPQGE